MRLHFYHHRSKEKKLGRVRKERKKLQQVQREKPSRKPTYVRPPFRKKGKKMRKSLAPFYALGPGDLRPCEEEFEKGVASCMMKNFRFYSKMNRDRLKRR